jgi:hypothetical protein
MLPMQLVTPLGPEWLPVQLVGAFACAILSHRFIELPFMKSERFKRDGLAALLILLISVALVWNATLIIDQLVLRATL